MWYNTAKGGFYVVKIIKQVSMSKIEFSDESEDLRKIINDAIHIELGVWIEGVEFSQAYKMGHIDGLKAFYDRKTQEFPTGLIDQVDNSLKKLQGRYPSIQMEYINEYPDRWVEDSEFPVEIVLPDEKLGEITLRDYQYRSVREAVLQQTGIVHVATNGG